MRQVSCWKRMHFCPVHNNTHHSLPAGISTSSIFSRNSFSCLFTFNDSGPFFLCLCLLLRRFADFELSVFGSKVTIFPDFFFVDNIFFVLAWLSAKIFNGSPYLCGFWKLSLDCFCTFADLQFDISPSTFRCFPVEFDGVLGWDVLGLRPPILLFFYG